MTILFASLLKYLLSCKLIIIPLKENVSFRIQRLREIETRLKAKGYNANPYGLYSISIRMEQQ